MSLLVSDIPVSTLCLYDAFRTKDKVIQDGVYSQHEIRIRDQNTWNKQIFIKNCETNTDNLQ